MFAQLDLASIDGAVTDATGGRVSGARVAIRNVETDITVQRATNEEGLYSAPLLRPGRYEITVEAAGFKKAVRSSITLQIQDRLRLDFQLEVGQTSETIEVKAAAPLVDSESSATGSVIEEPTGEEAAWLASPEVQKAIAVVRNANKAEKAALPSSNLELDLGFDSMERVELVVALEREMNAQVDEKVIAQVYTVRELVDAVLQARGNAPAQASGARAVVCFEGKAEGAWAWSEALDLGGTLDTPERAQSFRAQAREVAASSRALGYLAGLDGGSSCQYLTHAEAVARMRALRTELPARKGAVALVAAPPTLAARLALLSFVFDGLTICAVGTPGRESVGLQPEWVVGPAGVQESERTAAPVPRRAAGLFERVLAPFRSDPRKAKLEM